jgi:hypothetical protein
MNRIERALILSVPIVTVLVEVIALAAAVKVPPHHFLVGQLVRDPLFFTAAGVSAFFSVERKEVVPLLALGIAFEVVRTILFAKLLGMPFDDAFLRAGPGLWSASLLLSGWRALQSKGAARLRALDALALKFALPGSLPLTLFALWVTYQVLPWTYDYYLYAFDGLLPLPFANIAGRAFAASPVASKAFSTVYHSFMLVACLFVSFGGNGRLSGALISRWIVAALFGSALYFVMPAVGPAVAFDATYPNGLPDPAAVPLALFPCAALEVRNAMPSLHTSWAFLVAIIAWRIGKMPFVLASINLAATVIATLGMREHYLIDLVVAVPFTVAVHGLLSLYDADGWRFRAAAPAVGGILLTAAWYLIMLFGIAALRSAPWMASALVLVTIIASGWLLCSFEREAELDAIRFRLGDLGNGRSREPLIGKATEQRAARASVRRQHPADRATGQ